MPITTQLDIYYELERSRLSASSGLAQLDEQLQRANLGLTEVREGLNNVQDELEGIRRNQRASLALQQEILNRDKLQALIEELIYSAEKMLQGVAADSSVAPSTKFFIVAGLISSVDQNGIATPVIRGLDNKARFDNALAKAKNIANSLKEHPEVKAAIEWVTAERAKQDKVRVEGEAKKAAEDQRKATQQKKAAAEALALIKSQITELEGKKLLGIVAWNQQVFSFLRPVPKPVRWPIQALLWMAFYWALFPAYLIMARKHYFGVQAQLESLRRRVPAGGR